MIAYDILTDYGPFVFGNRPVRTRMPGGVGAGGEKPPATRFGPNFSPSYSYSTVQMRALSIHFKNVGSLFRSDDIRKTSLLARVRETRKLQMS